LIPGTTYNLTIKARNLAGTSPASSPVVTFTTPLPLPVISGPTLLCAGASGSYSATNWVPGTYKWYANGFLTLSNSTVNPASLSSPNGSNGGPTTLSIKNEITGATLATYQVWLGKPYYQLSGPTSTVLSKLETYTMSTTPGAFTQPTATSTSWSATPNQYQLYQYGNTFAQIIFTTQSSQHYVKAVVSNSCGSNTAYHYVDVDCVRTSCPHPPTCPCISVDWSPPPPYPNPANDMISIEIDAEAMAQSNALAQNLTDGKPLKLNVTFDVRLYDGQGNQLRQTTTKGGTVQFNVSALPDGIYYLHIYDGVNSTPEIQQILVEH